MLQRVILFTYLCTFIYSFEIVDTVQSKINVANVFRDIEAKECRKRDFMKSNSILMKKSLCSMPMDTLVELVPHAHNVQYTPSAVHVKRCGGVCSNNLFCMPTETRKVEFGIKWHSVGERTSSCRMVTVEEHVMCKCKCATMKKDCNKKQEYRANECMCHCNNMEEMEACESQNKLWDQKECKCNCRKEEPCATDHSWVPQYCKCMKVM